MTALLILLTIVCFVMIHVTQYYERKYRGMSDFSKIAEFAHTYWRTSRALSTPFYTGLYLCVWLLGRDYQLIQIAGMAFLCIGALSLCCLVIMTVGTLLEKLFDSSEWMYDIHSIRQRYYEWSDDFRKERKDMISAFLINALGIVLILVMFADIIRVIASS